ncbi:MAG: hypothetical protein NC187_09740 [Candidatus Amulumruptor caecigallinarius]|nr:hypothetical protein [Candidatus Amulumruptor caecigallinarius]MCM1397749.1 hypothetical protein [Candidatus Amulumruptor caecigallinarius]MCM1454788.1 hypothetical protein [bacterium]
MNYHKILLSMSFVAAASLALTSCNDDGYWDAGNVNANAVTSEGSTSFSQTFKPGDDIPQPTFTFNVTRTATEGAQTVALANTQSPEGSWSVPSSVTFAPGQATVEVPVSLLATEIGKYSCTVKLANADDLALGGTGTWSFSATIQGASPDPVWEDLGTGKYINKYFFDNTYDVMIQEDKAEFEPDQAGYYGHYRLVNPLEPGFQEEGYYAAGYMGDTPSQYIEFTVIGPGQTIPNTDVVVPADGEDYYLYIKNFYTGFFNPNYSAEVIGMFGANLVDSELDDFAGQKVLEWKNEPTEDNPKGYPGVVSMGVYWYMNGIGGWNYLNNVKDYLYVFPGYSLGDYTFELNYGGHLIKSEDEEYLVGDANWESKDIAYVYMGLVKTAVEADAIAAVTEAVAALQKDEPVSTDVKLAKLDKPGSAQFLADQGSGNYTIAAVSYNADGDAQESASVIVKFTSINDMGTNDDAWKSLGVGEYHDDILTFAYDLNPDYLTYEVEVQQSTENSALYRIVNPYGKGIYPYNIGDLTVMDEYMVFDTTNPQMVLIPPYVLGTIGSYGTCTVYSMSYYAQAQGMTDDQIIAAGYGGTFDLGIISFPADGILAELSGLGKIYYTNGDGLTELIIPDEGATTVRKAHKAVKSKPDMSVRHKALSQKRAANTGLMKKFGVKSAAKAPRKGNFRTPATDFRVPMAL